MQLSACIEMMFAAESGDPAERIRLAAAAGADAVEFWRWSDKDLGAIAEALRQTGMPLAAMVAEPFATLTDPAEHDSFLEGLGDSIAVAKSLGCTVLIAQAGPDRPGVERAIQRTALVEVLGRAAERLAGTGIRLGVEPLNTLIDHPGYFLPGTAEALDIIDEVTRPEVGLVFDLYHSGVMNEDLCQVIGSRADRLIHVHVADHPGRHEPGSGHLALAEGLRWLFAHGYSGRVGLEFRPASGSAAALAATRLALGAGA